MVLGGELTPGATSGLAFDGQLAFVPKWESSLVVLDVSDPRAPTEIGSVDVADAQSVVIDGSTAYVNVASLPTETIEAIDVSTPTAPVSLGRWTVPAGEDWTVVAVDAGLAVVEVRGFPDVFHLMDVSVPSAPAVLFTWPIDWIDVGAVVLQDSHVFFVLRSGVEIYDTSSPATLAGSFSLDADHRTTDIEVVGAQMFILTFALSSSSQLDALYVVDLSGVSTPTEIGRLELDMHVQNLAVDGDIAYVTTRANGLHVIDVVDPTAPLRVGSIWEAGAWLSDVHVLDEFLWLRKDTTTFRVVDPSVPELPRRRGSADTSGMAQDLEVQGDLIYVADGDSGLAIVDAADPDAPVVVGTLDTPGSVVDVEIQGTRAYLADAGSAVRVVDVTDPTTPTEILAIPMADVIDVEPSGDRVYALRGDPAVSTTIVGWDISSTSSPAFLGTTVAGSTTPTTLEVIGTVGYGFDLQRNGGAFTVYDLTTSPTIPYYLPLGYHSNVKGDDLAVSGTLAWVVEPGGTIVDVSEYWPDPIGDAGIPHTSISLNDGLAVASSYDSGGLEEGDETYGVTAVDYTNPEAPRELGGVVVDGETLDAVRIGRFAVVAKGAGGIEIVDLGSQIAGGPNAVPLGVSGRAALAAVLALLGMYTTSRRRTGFPKLRHSPRASRPRGICT